MSSRICAYCCLDHEVHGGCFTGKKPSELRAEMQRALRAAAASPAIGSSHRLAEHVKKTPKTEHVSATCKDSPPQDTSVGDEGEKP